MREYWIAIPNSHKSLKDLCVRVVRMRNMALGLTTMKIGELKFKFLIEKRTVVDAFPLLSHEMRSKRCKPI